MHLEKTRMILDQLVADLSQMAAQIQQTHWYMRGEGFLFLHPLMDEFKDEINEQLDLVAERLITIDGSPCSTLQEFADKTKIASKPGDWTILLQDRLAQLVENYRYLADTYQKAIEVTAEEHDDVTQDIVISAKQKVEQRIWMIQAELRHAPLIDPQ